jgi:hypothetical protein
MTCFKAQSCIDGWDQKSDVEKDGCCALCGAIVLAL